MTVKESSDRCALLSPVIMKIQSIFLYISEVPSPLDTAIVKQAYYGIATLIVESARTNADESVLGFVNMLLFYYIQLITIFL